MHQSGAAIPKGCNRLGTVSQGKKSACFCKICGLVWLIRGFRTASAISDCTNKALFDTNASSTRSLAKTRPNKTPNLTLRRGFAPRTKIGSYPTRLTRGSRGRRSRTRRKSAHRNGSHRRSTRLTRRNSGLYPARRFTPPTGSRCCGRHQPCGYVPRLAGRPAHVRR